MNTKFVPTKDQLLVLEMLEKADGNLGKQTNPDLGVVCMHCTQPMIRLGLVMLKPTKETHRVPVMLTDKGREFRKLSLPS